jgi:hypothetical protein
MDDKPLNKDPCIRTTRRDKISVKNGSCYLTEKTVVIRKLYNRLFYILSSKFVRFTRMNKYQEHILLYFEQIISNAYVNFTLC